MFPSQTPLISVTRHSLPQFAGNFQLLQVTVGLNSLSRHIESMKLPHLFLHMKSFILKMMFSFATKSESGPEAGFQILLERESKHKILAHSVSV